MTRAPHRTDNTLSRRRCHLRTHHCAMIPLSTRQKSMTPKKCRPYRPDACKADPALSLREPVHLVCQIGSEASPLPKSP